MDRGVLTSPRFLPMLIPVRRSSSTRAALTAITTASAAGMHRSACSFSNSAILGPQPRTHTEAFPSTETLAELLPQRKATAADLAMFDVLCAKAGIKPCDWWLSPEGTRAVLSRIEPQFAAVEGEESTESDVARPSQVIRASRELAFRLHIEDVSATIHESDFDAGRTGAACHAARQALGDLCARNDGELSSLRRRRRSERQTYGLAQALPQAR